ncbi:unnamed protein product [Urochloa humidicola]
MQRRERSPTAPARRGDSTPQHHGGLSAGTELKVGWRRKWRMGKLNCACARRLDPGWELLEGVARYVIDLWVAAIWFWLRAAVGFLASSGSARAS